MKLGGMYRDPQTGFILKLKGVNFGINELFPDQVECWAEQTFKVVGEPNSFVVRQPIRMTKSSLASYQDLADALYQLVADLSKLEPTSTAV